MANLPRQPRQPRPSALGVDHVPTISIDTGSAATAIAVRSGPVLLAAAVVLNPETTSERSTPGADPAIGYPQAVEDEVRRLAAEHADLARAWYGPGAVPADQDPWLYAVEKINPARSPRNDDEARHFDPIDVAEGSTFAANAVANRLLGVLHGRIAWVIPFHADTRWESRFEHGTGNPFDFYPAALLEPAIPGGDTGRTFPDRYLDQRSLQSTRVKDACAAWSIGTDAAEDYASQCVRMYGRVLPPHLAPNAVKRTSPSALNRDCGAPSVRRFDLGVQEDPAEVRFRFARERLHRLVQGDTQDPHAVARDLLVVAQHKGLTVEQVVAKWSGWVTQGIDTDQPDIFLPQVQVDTLRFVRRVKETTLRLVA